ncbi:hypothetical protein VTO42DRAFT_8198 [Malbranchea cinnamomea]
MSLPSDDRSELLFDGDSYSAASSEDSVRRKPRTNAATGASAAGVRALSAQAVAFYFRAPVKAFFRTRVDYMVLAKAINPQVAEGRWSWKTTTPGLLAHAVRTYGWRFIPDQVLPPLLANVGVGAVLYTSYLQVLGIVHEPTSQASKRVYPPPPPGLTLAAGFAAGAFQSLVAAPLDALQARFRTSDVLDGRYRNVWQYSRHKLQEIGVRGIFSGWSLSFLKDSLGSALFFCLFETVKSQGYYSFITWYYGSLQPQSVEKLSSSPTKEGDLPSIRPHYALEPCFLMLGGIAASTAQQLVFHPLGLIQSVYYRRLEHLDHKLHKYRHSRKEVTEHRREAYRETFRRCQQRALRVGGWGSLLYKGFWLNTIRQMPSTSAGLVIFELVRRKYGAPAESVHIQKDGYEIVLL